MTDFKAKMHKIQFRLGSAPDPAGGAYSAPRHLDGFKGPASKGRGYRKGGKGRGRGRQGRGREREGRKGGEGTPVCIFKFSLE